MDQILPHTRMVNAVDQSEDVNMLIHHTDVSFQIKKVIFESAVKVFGSRMETTLESFLEEAQKEQDYLNTVIEAKLKKEYGFGEGQQFVEEEEGKGYSIMYKTFLTKSEDDKSDLIELLTY